MLYRHLTRLYPSLGGCGKSLTCETILPIPLNLTANIPCSSNQFHMILLVVFILLYFYVIDLCTSIFIVYTSYYFVVTLYFRSLYIWSYMYTFMNGLWEDAVKPKNICGRLDMGIFIGV